MANEGLRKSLIDRIATADKAAIDFQSNIERKVDENNKLATEFDRPHTSDSRKKSIISRRSTLQKEIITLEKQMKDRDAGRDKDANQLKKLS